MTINIYFSRELYVHYGSGMTLIHFYTKSPNDENALSNITCLCEREKREHSEASSGSSIFYLKMTPIIFVTFYWSYKSDDHAIVEKVGKYNLPLWRGNGYW